MPQPYSSARLNARHVELALTGLETALYLIDHIDATLPPYETIVTVSAFKETMVGTTGIEPVTPTMSM